MRKSIIAKDGKAFFATLTEESQKSLEKQGEVLRTSDAGKPEDTAKELGVTVEEMNKMAPRDVAIGLMMAKVTDEQRKALETATLEDVKVDGDKASATRVMGEEKKPLSFAKAKEGWKYDLEATNGCKAPEDKKEDGSCEGSDEK